MKTSNLFEVGDAVTLSSGGLCMTVSCVSDVDLGGHLSYQRVWVKWFDKNGQIQHEELKNTYLKIIKEVE